MHSYVSRFTSLLRQVMAMEMSFGISALGRFCDAVKTANHDRQTELLDTLAERVATARMRLIDPQTLKVDAPSARRRASALLDPPRMTLEGRLAAAERRAAAAAFDFTTHEILAALDRLLLLKPHGMRLSEMPQRNAREALHAMHVLAAVLGPEGREEFRVEPLPERADTPTFETQDFIIGHRV
jgi:hypothetical protein